MYIFEIKPLSVASLAIIFSQSEGCLSTLLIVSFAVQKVLSFIRSHLFIFAFVSNILGFLTMKMCYCRAFTINTGSWSFLLPFVFDVQSFGRV